MAFAQKLSLIAEAKLEGELTRAVHLYTSAIKKGCRSMAELGATHFSGVVSGGFNTYLPRDEASLGIRIEQSDVFLRVPICLNIVGPGLQQHWIEQMFIAKLADSLNALGLAAVSIQESKKRWYTLLVKARWERSKVFAKGRESDALHSNLAQKCPICLETKNVVALTPCGHMVCVACVRRILHHSQPLQAEARATRCPVCRNIFYTAQKLFTT